MQTSSQPFELTGNDGKIHQVWATSAPDAFKAAWQYKHGGLAAVHILAIHDPNDKDCWKTAKRIQVGRQCDAVTVAVKKYGCWLDQDQVLRF